ncbi:uncharacterized protein ARMOST_22105 [Armillaria ostoyae]|uniref:Uncharacterized protein n=1 Tax=Armillaria ostoyae TaxID=47428 RepID=A0A284SBY2_ARMOS|nr:uncharacterized protein ARMOST_22086 [Armillaria ostoyae]SJL18513.1 uncharacterized protein ARMOST_22105 [Armillaria ostoyae]
MNRPYAHIRSSKSTSLGCDAFIWADIVASVLLIEFKSHLTLISGATLQRWMKELDPDSRSEFSPQKVVMHPYGVMSYAIEPRFSSTMPQICSNRQQRREDGLFHSNALPTDLVPSQDLSLAYLTRGSIGHALDTSLCPSLLHQAVILLCCPEFAILLLAVAVVASVFALASGDNRETLMLESIYSILSSKKFGLGMARYHDTPVRTTIFCNSLNAPPSLPKLSPSLGLIRCFEPEELRLGRSSEPHLDEDMWYVGY